MYSEVVKRGYNIVAVKSQSDGARKMWLKFRDVTGVKLWGVIGLRFFAEKKGVDDYIETLYITDRFVDKPINPELSAVVLTDNGVEDIRSMYVDTEGYEELESLLILTTSKSKVSKDLQRMVDFEDFPDEEKLYRTITTLLLEESDQ